MCLLNAITHSCIKYIVLVHTVTPQLGVCWYICLQSLHGLGADCAFLDILGWYKASRGRAFAHSIDSTGEGLKYPLLVYYLCSQRFIGINMCACSSGNRWCCVTVVEWKQLTMALAAQSMLHATKAQVIYFNSFEPRLSFGEGAWVQGYLLQ